MKNMIYIYICICVYIYIYIYIFRSHFGSSGILLKRYIENIND